MHNTAKRYNSIKAATQGFIDTETVTLHLLRNQSKVVGCWKYPDASIAITPNQTYDGNWTITHIPSGHTVGDLPLPSLKIAAALYDYLIAMPNVDWSALKPNLYAIAGEYRILINSLLYGDEFNNEYFGGNL